MTQVSNSMLMLPSGIILGKKEYAYANIGKVTSLFHYFVKVMQSVGNISSKLSF